VNVGSLLLPCLAQVLVGLHVKQHAHARLS
jgi:hypothetical protein